MVALGPGHPACSSRHFVRDLFRNVWLPGRDAVAGIDSAVLWPACTRGTLVWNYRCEQLITCKGIYHKDAQTSPTAVNLHSVYL